MRVSSVEKVNTDLKAQLDKANQKSHEANGVGNEVWRKELSQAKVYIIELEQKCLKLEAKLGQGQVGSGRVSQDSKYEKELEYIRKKYEDKCIEMLGMVKRLNSLSAFRNKSKNSHLLKETLLPENRDITPSPGSINSYQLRSAKALHDRDIHMEPGLIRRKPIARSKSTERLSGRVNRSSSRLKSNMSSSIRHLA